MVEQLGLRRLQVLSRCIRKAQYSTSACAAKPTLHLSKNSALIDEKVQIKVMGLSKYQKITLHSFLKDSEKLFAACGHYIANEAGEVDTFQHSSYGGTFKDVESMGLFWSMMSQNLKKPRRILKADVRTPFDVKISIHDGFLNFEDLPWTDDFSCLNDCYLQRYYTAPGVKRISIRENGLYGTLFLPPGKGPFPAIMEVLGMTGGISELRASLLASHGIAGFALGYINFEDLPKNEWELDYNYFLKAFDWLAAHPSIDEKALGGISNCVGGGLLGVVALKRPSMKCYVSINNTHIPIGKEQVIEGEQIKSAAFNWDILKVTSEGVFMRSMYSEYEDASFTPIWRHGIKVLHINGLDDQCVHPDVAKKFQRTIPQEFRDNFTFIGYPGAGHLIEPPFMPLCKSSFNDIFKKYLIWGGDTKLHADAQEDSWLRMMNFLQTHLQNGSIFHVIG